MSVIDTSQLGAGSSSSLLDLIRATVGAGAAAGSHDYTTSVWGSPIPLSQGNRAITGVPLWFGPLVATTAILTTGTAQVGSGLGLNGAESMTTRFSRDFAVAFGHNLGRDGEHADPQARRIWINGVLSYDATGGLPAPVDPVFATNAQRLQMAYAKFLTALKFTLYPGTQTQTADPLMLADKGDLCSDYHGLIYIVFHDVTMGQNISTHTEQGQDFNSLMGGLDLWASQQEQYTNGAQEAHLFGVDDQGAAFPHVQVEFVDGIVTQATSTPISNAGISSNNIDFVNWPTRIAKTFSIGDQMLHTIDLNAEIELPTVQVTGIVDTLPISAFSLSGPVSGPCLWEQIGNFFYSKVGGGNSGPVVAINADTGVITSQAFSGSNDLRPTDAAFGDCYTLHTPCTHFPTSSAGCLCYALDGSTTPTPVVCLQGSDIVALPVVTPGQLPAVAPYGSFFRPGAAAATNGVVAVPLGEIAVSKGTSSQFQDIAFLYLHDSVFDIEFFSVHAGVAQYIQSSLVLDAGAGRLAMSALFDPSDSGVLLFHCLANGTDWRVTKLPMVFGSVTVPGFRGLSPSFGPAVYKDISIPLMSAAQNTISMGNSDLSQGTFGYTSTGGAVVLQLATGATTTTSFVGGFLAPAFVWDSKSATLYGGGSGFLNKLPIAQSVTNTGALPLSTYLRWLALEAGYTLAQINIDPHLTDPVDGAMLLQATDTASMFDSLGQLYDFTSFESEGQIKFVPASHNPLKATGTLNMGQPAEGDQITLGSTRYRFTTNPSVINDVRIGSSPATSVLVLEAAINATGVPGQDYFPGLKQNPDAEASIVAGQLLATARYGGTIGNSIPTTVQVGAETWSHPTLTGGDVPPVPTINLTPADMAPMSENTIASDNEVLVTTLNQPNSVPSAMSINFWDETMNYQRNTQTFQPDASVAAGAATAVTALESIFVMTSADAYRRVSRLAIRATQAAVTQEFRLPWKFLYIEPSDVVGITLAPFAYVVRLDECTINGDFSISCSGMNYAFRDDIPVPDQTILGLINLPPASDGSGIPVVLDVPLYDARKGTTPGSFQLEVGVKATNLLVDFGTSAVAYGPQADGNMVNFAQYDTDLKYGTVTTALPDTAIPFQTDNVTSLTLVGKTAVAALFQGGTQLDALNGKNCILIGAPGRWEYIYFRDVTVINEKVVTISGLLRGRRGTEVNTGSHVAGETFYLLASLNPVFSPAIKEQLFADANVGLVYDYRAASVPANRSLRATITFSGLSLYPFAPCRLVAKLNQPTNNNLLLSWVRRDRGATHWISLPTEMSETVEHYDLDIYNGATLVRTLTNLTTPAYTYSVADQTTDGFAAPLTTLKFAVCQKGELGRGFQRLETVNVS